MLRISIGNPAFRKQRRFTKRALRNLTTSFLGYSPETATCLQGLGDTYYFQSRYLAAQDHYKRLLSMRERLATNDPRGLVTALIKMAKNLREVERT